MFIKKAYGTFSGNCRYSNSDNCTAILRYKVDKEFYF